jgi:hypothetical protein
MTWPLIFATASLPFRDFVTRAAQEWMLSGANLFWAEGNEIMHAMAKLAIGMCALTVMVEILSGGTGEGAIGKATYRIARFAIALWLITYYNRPFYGGLSFHQLMPEQARRLAIIADDGSVAKAQEAMDELDQTETADTSWWDIGELASLWAIKGAITLYSGFMLFLSASGYILMAVGVTAGPLSIPFLTFERTAFLFWDWFGFWIASSMYQVVASILTNIFANIELLAMPNFVTLSGLELAGAQFALLLALFLTTLMVGGICAALYGKAAGAAANIGSYIGGYVSSF